MKKRILSAFMLSFLFLANSVSAQEWYQSSVPFGIERDVNSVAITANGVIFGAGGHEYNDSIQSIWRTETDGLNWDQTPIGNIPSNLSSWIKSIAFADTLHGFGVGYNGKMVITNNGGNDWTFVNAPIYRHFNKVVYASATVLYAVGGVSSNDTLEGLTTVQTIVKSTDGGNTWNLVRDTASNWLRSVYFTDTLHGLAVGDSATVMQTIDGGVTWTSVACPVLRDLNGVDFVNPDTGYIVGGTYDNLTRTILQTANGGQNWTVLRDEAGPHFTDISFSSQTRGYIVGDSTTFLTSANGGQTWTNQQVDPNNTAAHFTSVKFLNSGLGAIGCLGGVIYIYTKDTFPQSVTMGAEPTDSSATLIGGINTHGYAATYSFVYSNDPGFASFFQTTVEDITSDSLVVVSAAIGFLNPGTTYYYYISATTVAGTVNGSTLNFNTNNANLTFQTLGATNISTTGVQLNGVVDKLPQATNLWFEYGTTQALSSQLAATPASINDTLQHFVNTQLGSLSPGTTYYFRLFGVSASGNYYGNTYSFTTGTPSPVLQTLPPDFVGSNGAQLNGSVSGSILPITLSFKYGSSTAMNSQTGSFVLSSDPGVYVWSFSLSSLMINQKYYYRLIGTTSQGTFSGEIDSFSTFSVPPIVQTLEATNVTASSATLNGSAGNFFNPAVISFEYGTTLALGTTVIATPDSISDTLQHAVSASISGFQANTTYYYRLACAEVGDSTYYGNIKQVFVGDCEIPNCDFQDWISDTVLLPAGWNLLGNNFQRVAGHSGNYALQINGFTIAMLGIIGNSGPIAGQAFLARPDSLSFWVNCNIVSGDTGSVLGYLYKDTSIIGTIQVPIVGNTGGTFKKISFPWTYLSGATPDSLVMGLVATNTNNPVNDPGEFLAVDDIAFSSPSPTVYNGGFETWFNFPNKYPASWSNIKYLLVDSSNFQASQMVEQIYFEAPSDFAAQVRNVPLTGDLAGLFIGGDMGTQSSVSPLVKNEPSFPVYAKHTELDGYYKFLPVNGDSMSIEVDMWKQGQKIGTGFFTQHNAVNQFSPFEIEITYPGNSLTPDSSCIEIRFASANGASVLAVDKLHFDGFVPVGIQSVPIGYSQSAEGIRVYPNPSSGLLILETIQDYKQDGFIRIMDMSGKIVKEQSIPAGLNKSEIETSEITSGFYLLRYTNGDRIFNKKIIVLK